MKTLKIESAWRGVERCRHCAIRHLVLFADLEYQDFDRIHHPIDDIEYEPGKSIYMQGEDIAFVFTIRSGLVKLVQTLPDGTGRIVRLLSKGDLAGLETLNRQVTDHQAIALDNVQVCRIPRSVVESLRRDTPRLHDTLLQRWQKALSSADNWITRMSTGPAKLRVARLLLYLDTGSEGESFYLPTREDMGAMLGVTPESVSKVTAEFRRKGWLKVEGPNKAWLDVQSVKSESEGLE